MQFLFIVGDPATSPAQSVGRSEGEEGNYVKAAGKYACFYQEMKNDDVAGNGPKAVEFLRSKAKVVPPFY